MPAALQSGLSPYRTTPRGQKKACGLVARMLCRERWKAIVFVANPALPKSPGGYLMPNFLQAFDFL
ncbi:MAG: hypothetical protein ACLGIY_18015, partial [Betaproteobacteria bacterium]